MKVIGYVRESTTAQVVHGYNMDDQIRQISQYVQLYYGVSNVQFEIYKEEGVSGKSLERSQIKKVLQLAESNLLDVLIIYSLDRLTRNICDLEEIISVLDKSNVKLVSVSDHFDTKTPTGRFFIKLIALIAQWELDSLSSRTKRGKRESAIQGNYSKGRAPIGYRSSVTQSGKLEVVSEEAEIIRMIFEQISSNHETSYTLANKLKLGNVLNRSWCESEIRRIVSNRIYYGALEYSDVLKENCIEPIVSKDLWDAANDINNNKNYHYHKYLFNGTIICNDCHSIMGHCPKTKHSSGKVYLYYRCPKCHRSINEQKLKKILQEDLDHIARAEYQSERMVRLKKQLSKVEKELNQLHYDLVYNNLSVKFVEDEISKLLEQKCRLVNELMSVNAGDQSAYFDGLDIEEQQALLDKYVSNITVDMQRKQAIVNFEDGLRSCLEKAGYYA